jgi:cytochrome bd-type quinol oxidase subunit 2
MHILSKSLKSKKLIIAIAGEGVEIHELQFVAGGYSEYQSNLEESLAISWKAKHVLIILLAIMLLGIFPTNLKTMFA